MNLQSAQRILVCLGYGIGDVVMQTPALSSLRRTCPAAYITALGARPAIELLENDSRVNELICAQDWGLSHWGDSGTPAIKQAIRRWLADENYDVILDPYHAVVAVRDVLWERQTTILDTGEEAQNEALKTHAGGVAAVHAATLKAWGLTASCAPCPRLYLQPGELRFAEQFFFDHGLNGRPPVAISPVASSSLKRWPVERLAAAADRIVERYRSELLLICGPQRDCVAEFLNKSRYADQIVVMDRVHLRRVAAILSRCAMLIGNDTGLMHVAATVRVPVVAVFGPTSSSIYLPSEASAASGNVECPYRKTTEFGPPECVVENRCLIGDQSCISQVDVAQVMTAVEAVAGAKSPSRAAPRQLDPVFSTRELASNLELRNCLKGRKDDAA